MRLGRRTEEGTGGLEHNSGVGSSGRRAGSEGWVRSLPGRRRRGPGKAGRGWEGAGDTGHQTGGSVGFLHRRWEAAETWGQRKGDSASPEKMG